jgi:hypothetical protein
VVVDAQGLLLVRELFDHVWGALYATRVELVQALPSVEALPLEVLRRVQPAPEASEILVSCFS